MIEGERKVPKCCCSSKGQAIKHNEKVGLKILSRKQQQKMTSSSFVRKFNDACDCERK